MGSSCCLACGFYFGMHESGCPIAPPLPYWQKEEKEEKQEEAPPQ